MAASHDKSNLHVLLQSNAKEDFDSDDWERKRLVIKQLGAGLKLSGRTIEFTPVKYLVPVAEGQDSLKAKKRGGSNRFSTDEKKTSKRT